MYRNWYKPNRRQIAGKVRSLILSGKTPTLYRNYPDGFVANSYKYKKLTRRFDYPIVNGRVLWNKAVEDDVPAQRSHGQAATDIIMSENGGRLWTN